MYPRIDGSGSIQIGPSSYVSRSTVESDREAIIEVRKDKQTAEGIDLGVFLQNRDQYFTVRHGESVGPNLRAAGSDFVTFLKGKRSYGENSYDVPRMESLGGAIINSIDAVMHAVKRGLGK